MGLAAKEGRKKKGGNGTNKARPKRVGEMAVGTEVTEKEDESAVGGRSHGYGVMGAAIDMKGAKHEEQSPKGCEFWIA